MRTTPEETQRNDRRILEAATRIFAEKGYSDVNMQDIADELGMTRGPLYYRYKTKADLFEAALLQSAQDQYAAFSAILSQDKPFLEIMQEFLQLGTGNIMAERYHLSELTAQARTEQMKSAVEQVKSYQAQLFEAGKDCVARAVQKGELRQDTDPDQLMIVLLVFAKGLHCVIHETGMISQKEETDACIESILFLIKERYCK